ncbi:hypothetical protein C1646_772464 [Rhizophagus diaphanus]|nr:hypothetical protein C1646_772464 [Rhizophagus diaphanus] [Rhizophagus sp. MUCL 43196]
MGNLMLLKLTISILSPEGETNFISMWKSFKHPRQWSKLLNPISHIESYMMSDCLRLGMVIPFILNRSLTVNCLKPQELARLQERTNLNRNQVINMIVKCWAIVAKCSQLAFKTTLTNNNYDELAIYLKKEREALIEVKLMYGHDINIIENALQTNLEWIGSTGEASEFSNDFVGLPNLHASCHLLRHARTFGTLVNTAVRTKEMVHRILKNIVPHTNCKNIEFDLLKHYTTLQAIRHLADGGIDPRNLRHSVEFMNISQDFNHLFKDWFIMESSEADNVELEVCSQSSQFRNIILRKPVSAHNTNIRIDTVSFKTDLALAYESFGYRASLINQKCNFYEGASYIQYIHNAKVQCHLNTDDIVTIQVEDYGESFAVIRAIFKYKSNNGYLYPFIYVDWFEDTYKIHGKLDCLIYVL